MTRARTYVCLLVLFFAPLVGAAEPKVERGIPYALPKHEQQTLDVYAPAAGKNHPVALWIHGGGWHSGDKSDVGSKPQALVDRGFVFVSINYRLWPSVTIRQIAEDVAKAIRWTHEHAAEYGGDPKRLFILGHSAGAQLAALVCTDERYLKAENLSFALIKGCVPVDGDTYDLPMRFATVKKSGNQKLAERDQERFGDEQRQREMSSLTYIARGKHIPPFLILHVADYPDTGGQSRRLYQALQEAGVPARIYPAEGKDHKTINNDLGTPGDRPSQALYEFLHETSAAAGASGKALEPWASKAHPQDVARRHVEDITASEQAYRIDQGGTMDGTNCRSPVGGGFGIWDQTWESNRAVRLENIGSTDVINPWLSNGRNDFRSMAEIVARAVRPGMTDREKAIALWRLQTTHRFHAGSGDNEVNDPVKVFNVYGYTTCGNDSICLAGLWQAAGLQVRPARCPGHCISQVFYDGRWHLLDGDMGPFYLLRDNRTIASEHDLVRDHDLVKRSHTGGILDPDSRSTAEAFAGLFVSESDWKGNRNSVRGTTMNMVLRPGEALVWRWGHLNPVKYHGRTDIKVFGPRKGPGKVWGAYAAERICNGRWEYRPDFTSDVWRQGAEAIADVRSEDGALVPASGKTGAVVWKMRSPYPFVGGALEAQGSGTKFFLSWDGNEWHDVGDNLEAFFHFPHKGDARYAYWLKCALAPGARLERLALVNDLQMAPLALPGMVGGANRFTYTDQSPEARKVRITHEWVERSLSRPPAAPTTPIFPTDRWQTDGTHITFLWIPPHAGADRIVDYHFELSDRPDLAWPLSANFEKLISNTADRGQARYTLPEAGLLTPGTQYYWRVRAKNDQGVWGPWSATWRFTAGGPAAPLDMRLEPAAGGDRLVLHWQANPAGRPPVKYRVYGSDEQGFSVSDTAYRVHVGQSKELPAQFPANFVAETQETELSVLGVGNDLPNANRAFYRVVAVDDKGHRSGPSDFVAAPRPYIHSKPLEAARVGSSYRCQVATIRSLGDLRMRIVEGKEVTGFWDIEQPRFALVKGPSWLRVEERTGVLSGVPDAPGTVDIVVSVRLERTVRRLDDARLSWGHELVKEIATEAVGSATQRFQITVSK